MREPSVTKLAAEARTPGRDVWLDLLRSAAILSVMAYHVMQMSSPKGKFAWGLLRHGHIGVDLFFVLSGWLIGGLYWKERARHGAVALGRFWQRRWWRTIPAYLVALVLSWLAVYTVRGQAFDPSFLLFLQNYREEVPFFAVSWSLCIEEHAYLILPVAVLLFSRARLSLHFMFAALFVMPLVLRGLHIEQGLPSKFGYLRTATHLRWDGLVAAFWASQLVLADGALFAKVRRFASYSLIVLAPALAWSLSDKRLEYLWLPTVSAACFLALLLAGVGRQFRERASGAIYAIAVSSYSLYLTHALMIHVARMAAPKLGAPHVTYFVAVLPLIAGAGAAFYHLVERPSLRLRDRLSPPRTAHKPQDALPSAQLEPSELA